MAVLGRASTPWIEHRSLLVGVPPRLAVALSFPLRYVGPIECGGDPVEICAMGAAAVAGAILVPGAFFGLLAAFGLGLASYERNAVSGLTLAMAVCLAGHLLLWTFFQLI